MKNYTIKKPGLIRKTLAVIGAIGFITVAYCSSSIYIEHLGTQADINKVIAFKDQQIELYKPVHDEVKFIEERLAVMLPNVGVGK